MQKMRAKIMSERELGIGPWKKAKHGTKDSLQSSRIGMKPGLQVFPSTDVWLILDYTQTAEKAYKHNLKGFKPDLEAYKNAKATALGDRDANESEDADRKFYTDANSLGFVEHKPTKESIDRLVDDTKKREAEKEAKRRKKRAGEDDDISYINKRNKVFNQKLARFYDQYTRETKEAFERGSGI
jgi:pre-mRNA-splicing factor SYF2